MAALEVVEESVVLNMIIVNRRMYVFSICNDGQAIYAIHYANDVGISSSETKTLHVIIYVVLVMTRPVTDLLFVEVLISR